MRGTIGKVTPRSRGKSAVKRGNLRKTRTITQNRSIIKGSCNLPRLLNAVNFLRLNKGSNGDRGTRARARAGARARVCTCSPEDAATRTRGQSGSKQQGKGNVENIGNKASDGPVGISGWQKRKPVKQRNESARRRHHQGKLKVHNPQTQQPQAPPKET